MQAVFILIVIFSFIIIVSSIDERAKKRKMDTELRMREMRGGYPPGTYSEYHMKGKKRKRSKESDFPPMAESNQESQRELLRKGIDDLQQRLDNIETIMKSRKADEKEYKE